MTATTEGRVISNRAMMRLQRDILLRDLPVRAVTSALAYALSMFFAPPPVLIACMTVHVLAEFLSDRAMRGLDPDRDPLRYRAALVAVFVVELAFVLPPAIIWHHPSPYAKALAVGLATATVMHLSTIRSIYLPIGRAGLLAVVLASASTAWLYWWRETGQLVSLPLAFSLLSVAGTGGYGFAVLRSNHALHLRSETEKLRAQAANDTKTRFLAQMSHELRTPLNAILGLGRAELDRSPDALSRERLSVLIASAEGLSAQLEDILDTAALDEGALPLRPVTAVPAALIRSTAGLFRPMIEAQGLRLDLSVDPALDGPAVFDPNRLRQCLTNLLSNAAKVTQAGTITIAAHLIDEGGEPGLLRIDITDTGPGIPPALRDRLFERYVTQDNGAGSAGGRGRGGRGLGLSISRALARRMGGDLTLAPLTGAAGHGAHFILTVLLAPTQQTAPPGPVALPMVMHVLLVDDIATNRMVARHMLEEMGATVTEAASGEAALQHVAGADLVLLDLNMPGLDGLATLARLRARPGGRALPVVALTADAGPSGRAGLLAAGFDGFLGKPLTEQALRDEIGHVLAMAAPGCAISG